MSAIIVVISNCISTFYLVHKYFKRNKDQHEKNYYRKIIEENKWLKKLSLVKIYQKT